MFASWFQRDETAAPPAPAQLQIGNELLPVTVIPNARARRYVLRLTREGVVRVTVPRGGSAREALAFAHRQAGWIARQREKLRQRGAAEWQEGTELLFRGELHALRFEAASGEWHFADQRFWASPEAPLRAAVELHLWNVAARELPPRVGELAQLHTVAIRRVTVRNQRSRWGSCSVRGTISLNWRLIQTPAFVSDYIILHELMHVRQMNHSVRFWREVAAVCPQWREAERWLRKHSRLIRG
jgi:predicted metal-dependent hydrolase